jgi:hypothetical protein
MLAHLGICCRYPHFEIAVLHNKIFYTISKFPKCTPVCQLHMAFQVPYIYDYITKLCRQQAEVLQNDENANFHDIRKVKPDTENNKGLKLGCNQAQDCSSD